MDVLAQFPRLWCPSCNKINDIRLLSQAYQTPRISASSCTPPSEKRTKSRPVALAIDLPSEVLPTPAGPTRHRIGPVSLLARCCTARYSTIRSLTFSRPKWSLSRTSWARRVASQDAI